MIARYSCAIVHDTSASIVLFVVVDDDNDCVEKVRAVFDRQLPSHMHPSIIIAIDQLPITKHGKSYVRYCKCDRMNFASSYQ